MGKRARIVKIEEDRTVRSVHVQWADPIRTGEILYKHFSNEDEVDLLLDYGHLDGLSKLSGQPKDYPSSYKSGVIGETVVKKDDKIWPLVGDGFISLRPHRSGGKSDIDKSFRHFIARQYDMDRYFLYNEGEWWVSVKDVGRLVPIEKFLKFLDNESIYGDDFDD